MKKYKGDKDSRGQRREEQEDKGRYKSKKGIVRNNKRRRKVNKNKYLIE